jgi:hypothetical protein
VIKINQKIISANLSMLCALLAGGAFQVQAQGPSPFELSNEDKSAIVKSVLQQELKELKSFQGVVFEELLVSSENIEFMEPSEMSRLGFRVINAALAKGSFMISEYVALKKIEASGDHVLVTLARMVEGHPCFSPPVSRAQTVVYRYHMEFGRWSWTGELIRKTHGQPGRLLNTSRWSGLTGAPLRRKVAP